MDKFSYPFKSEYRPKKSISPLFTRLNLHLHASFCAHPIIVCVVILRNYNHAQRFYQQHQRPHNVKENTKNTHPATFNPTTTAAITSATKGGVQVWWGYDLGRAPAGLSPVSLSISCARCTAPSPTTPTDSAPPSCSTGRTAPCSTAPSGPHPSAARSWAPSVAAGCGPLGGNPSIDNSILLHKTRQVHSESKF